MDLYLTNKFEGNDYSKRNFGNFTRNFYNGFKNAVIGTLALGAVAILPADSSYAQIQDSDQSRCISTMYRDGSKVFKAQAKEAKKCTQKYGSDGLGMQTLENCITEDANGKVQTFKLKTINHELPDCNNTPDFGYTGSSTVNTSARNGALDLLENIYGNNLDNTIVKKSTDRDMFNCQYAVLRTAGDFSYAIQSDAYKFIKDALDTATSSQDLVIAITDGSGTKSQRKESKLRSLYERNCNGVDINLALPGVNTTGSTIDNLVDLVECNACKLLVDIGNLGLELNCDTYDNQLSDGSCSDEISFTSAIISGEGTDNVCVAYNNDFDNFICNAPGSSGAALRVSTGSIDRVVSFGNGDRGPNFGNLGSEYTRSSGILSFPKVLSLTALGVPAGTSSSRGINLADADADGEEKDAFFARDDKDSYCLHDGFGNQISCKFFDEDPKASSAITSIGDINGDGRSDIVVANYKVNPFPDGETNVLYLSDGMGGYNASNLGDPLGYSTDILGVDLNGDSKKDLVVANANIPTSIGLGDGLGGFTWGTNVTCGTSNSASGVDAGDINGDGKLDLILSKLVGPNCYLLGDGLGGFNTPTDVVSDSFFPFDVALGQLNPGTDSYLDAVFIRDGSPAWIVWGESEGLGSNYTQIGPSGAHGNRTDITDVNGDGLSDIGISYYLGETTICINNGDATFNCSGVGDGSNPSTGIKLTTGIIN